MKEPPPRAALAGAGRGKEERAKGFASFAAAFAMIRYAAAPLVEKVETAYKDAAPFDRVAALSDLYLDLQLAALKIANA